jgi:cytochrome b561
MPTAHEGFRLLANSIHWLLIFGSLVLIGSGWYMRHADLTDPDRRFWLDSHISLGLSCAVLILLQGLLRAIRGRIIRRDGIPQLRQPLADATRFMLYVSLGVVIAAGYLEAVESGKSVSYWGIPLPPWDAAGLLSAPQVAAIHRVGAFVVGGLVVVSVAVSSLNVFRWGRMGTTEPAPPPVEPEPGEAAARELVATQNLVAFKTVRNLAHTLRLFGWIVFWTQLVLGLIIGLLLAFAWSGAAFSPSRPGFGNSIYWGFVGFVLLIPAVLLAFIYVRASSKVTASPTKYLHHKKRIAFWFLWTGLLTGGIGIFVSFVGVTMSIALLIMKTISQPPGIAITDPNNIIRALDVFVLIVNFMSLIAHFVGVVAALWLGFRASKARVDYVTIKARPE